jgi:hypothetical protein
MEGIFIRWLAAATLAWWVAYRLAIRDVRSKSLLRITLAGALLAITAADLARLTWLPKLFFGSLIEQIAYLALWAMLDFGAALCVGAIIGTLVGMLRSRDRYPS